MTILKFSEFLKMPEGTIFCDYQPLGNFGPLRIKLETVEGKHGAIDFFYRPIGDEVEHDGSGDDCEVMMRAESGEDIPMVFDTVCREGLFDPGALYAVWSRSDIEGLVNAISEVVK